MCGGKDCSVCAWSDGDCLTAMYEDNFSPATKEQIEERLKNNKYPYRRNLMLSYLDELQKKTKERTKERTVRIKTDRNKLA